MNDLKLGEFRVYSADRLLKEKPERLEGFKIICNEKPDNYSIEVNGAHVFCRDYNIYYGNGWIIIHLVDKYGNEICNISAFGSNEYKKDECFIVGYGKIMSQTSLRVLNGINEQAME